MFKKKSPLGKYSPTKSEVDIAEGIRLTVERDRHMRGTREAIMQVRQQVQALQSQASNMPFKASQGFFGHSIADIIKKIFDDIPPDKRRCRICGRLEDELKGGGTLYTINLFAREDYLSPEYSLICSEDWEKMMGRWMDSVIPIDSPVHCKRCKSHIQACKCDSTKAIRTLKS